MRNEPDPNAITRARLAATTLGVFAASYAMLGAWYLYHDFFKFLGRGAPTVVDGAGYAVAVNCHLWTVLSPWRVVGILAAVVLLAVSARWLYRGRTGARALSLFTLWGVLLPQVLWYTEFVVDWRAGFGLTTTALLGVAVVLIPTMLLFEGKDTLADWRRISAGRLRLLLTAVAATWIAYGATQFLDHSYQLNSGVAYGSALLALGFGCLAAFGLMRLKVWGLFAAIAAAGSLAVVPLAFHGASYVMTGGFIDSFVFTTSATLPQSIFSATVPLIVVYVCARPFLRSAMARLRG